jgi:hypothetical protein
LDDLCSLCHLVEGIIVSTVECKDASLFEETELDGVVAVEVKELLDLMHLLLFLFLVDTLTFLQRAT